MGRNIIDISGQNKKIVITNNVLKNSITIDVPETTTISLSETKTNIVEVITKGPKGIKGSPGTLTFFEDLTITGSLFVSGGLGGGDITGSNILSTQGFVGNLEGTASNASSASNAVSASYALTASHALDAISASYALTSSHALDAISSSYALTASHALDAISSSYALTASHALDAISSSYALTASHALDTISASFSATASYVKTAQTASFITGSGVKGVVTSASFASFSTSASYASSSTSASFATTASFALNVPENTGFPFTGSAEITGSLTISSSAGNSISTTQPIEAPSYKSNNAVVLTYRAPDNLYSFGAASSRTSFLGTAVEITAPLTASIISASIISASFVSASNLSGFPFTGSAAITGSLSVTGSIEGTTGSFDHIEIDEFVKTGTGVPTISSATNLVLTASNAISIKDGPSSIDLRGVTTSLSIMYKDLCSKYENLLTKYRYEKGSGDGTPAGTAVLGPYSPASWGVGFNDNDGRYY